MRVEELVGFMKEPVKKEPAVIKSFIDFFQSFFENHGYIINTSFKTCLRTMIINLMDCQGRGAVWGVYLALVGNKTP